MNVYVRSNGKLFGPVDFSKVSLACQQGLFGENAEISEDRIEWLSIAEAQELLKPKNAEIAPLPVVPNSTQLASVPPATPSPMADLIQPAISLSNPSVCIAQPAPVIIPSARYAGFWRRFTATVVDGLVLFVPGYCISFSISYFFRGDLISVLLSFFLQNLFGILLGWVYNAAMESSTMQGTLGKKALGIKVTDLSGNPVSFDRASGRYFGKYLSILFLGFGYFMIVFTDKKQGLHDRLAGCLVVQREQQ